MGATSIHIRTCKVGSSEIHNMRCKNLSYVREDLSKNNEQLLFDATPLTTYLKDLRDLVKNKTGRKMQAKATPIKEGVIVINEKTTMNDLKDFAEAMQKKFGVKPLQIYIHKDEGHTNPKGEWMPNLHAHMVFDWVNHSNGKSIRLNKQDMSDMQTILAECLHMDRGIPSDAKHMDMLQYKAQAAQKELEELQAKTLAKNVWKVLNGQIGKEKKELSNKVEKLEEEKNYAVYQWKEARREIKENEKWHQEDLKYYENKINEKDEELKKTETALDLCTNGIFGKFKNNCQAYKKDFFKFYEIVSMFLGNPLKTIFGIFSADTRNGDLLKNGTNVFAQQEERSKGLRL